MTCRLDRLWPPTWLGSGLRRGDLRAVSITPTTRQDRSANFSLLTFKFAQPGAIWRAPWPARAHFLGPEPHKSSILFESGVEFTKPYFSTFWATNRQKTFQSIAQVATRLTNWAQKCILLLRTVPQNAHFVIICVTFFDFLWLCGAAGSGMRPARSKVTPKIRKTQKIYQKVTPKLGISVFQSNECGKIPIVPVLFSLPMFI